MYRQATEGIPGDMFTYRSRGTVLRPRSGAGQVLGLDRAHDIIFVALQAFEWAA
jgi:hypothetical protein